MVNLSDKQRAFIEYYLTHWNATQAAIAAGYSAKTARSIGSENLTKPDIQAAIQARLTELKMSADEVLTRLTAQARGSLAPFLRVRNGDLTGFDLSEDKPLHLLKKASVTRRTFKETTEEKVTIELIDSQAALFKLGEHHKLFGKSDDILKYIDLTKLSPEQLERIANGEDPLAVILSTTNPTPSAG
jgi:hypothetical protein